MAIGTTAAILGSAAIGAIATGAAASSNSKAANQASQAQQQSNAQAIAAQEKARSENMALQRPLYDAGMPAVNARNALLGLSQPQQAAQTQPAMQQQPNALAQFAQQQGGMMDGPERNLARGVEYRGRDFGMGPMAYSANQTDRFQQLPTAQPTVAAQAGPAGNPQADAFEAFRNSTGYQFRVNEGMDALNSGYAGSGVLQSGAALKALDDYRQGMASSEFGNYWNMLGEQQNLASGAANAMSGVNTNYANNAGNIAMNSGNQQAQLAMMRGANTAQTIGGIGAMAGNALGMLAWQPASQPYANSAQGNWNNWPSMTG